MFLALSEIVVPCIVKVMAYLSVKNVRSIARFAGGGYGVTIDIDMVCIVFVKCCGSGIRCLFYA
jgi:hypothetical protein